MFVQIKYLTLQAVLSSSAALLLITKVLCLQGRKGWFALQERFHVLLLVDESFRLDALSSSKNTLKEVGCNQYLKITLNEKGSLFSRVYGLFTAPVKKEEAHRPVSKFPFKPLLCVLKGFRFFFSLSVTQAKHCPWERLSYMSATCCSYRRYFCPLPQALLPDCPSSSLLFLTRPPRVLPTVCQPQDRHLLHLVKFDWFFKPCPKCPSPVSLPLKPNRTTHLSVLRALYGLIILAHIWERSTNGRPELQRRRSGSSVTASLPWRDDESTAQAAAMGERQRVQQREGFSAQLLRTTLLSYCPE